VIRPRDGWTDDRAAIQPLQLVAGFAEWLAAMNEASAAATDLRDMCLRMEDVGVLQRLDPDVEPDFFRGAILDRSERATLRTIGHVVRRGRVRHVGWVEANRDDHTERNRLCAPNGFTPEADARNLACQWAATQRAVASWTAEPDLNAWLGTCRLTPLGNAGEHLGPAMDALIRMLQHQEAAIANLEHLLATPTPAPA
jgi:hypothetical protein